MNEFLQRLKQRKLVQWTLAYVAAAFALLQGIDIVAQRFGWPEQTMRLVIVALSVGFFVTLVLAWYHGERGAQRVSGTELLIIGLVLAVGGGFLWRFAAASRSSYNKSSAAPNESKTLEPVHPIPKKSIAVLPFENLSSDKDNAYFAEGIQDEILTKLAAISDLKVISRTSTAKYKSNPEDLKTVSQQLGVAHVLEGSVQKAGDKVRVNVQLIDARADSHLWAKSYDGDAKDIFGMETEVSQQVADALRARLSPAEAERLAGAPTANTEAYDFFLQGEFAEREAESSLTANDFQRAADLYQRAIGLDPNFANAYARLVMNRMQRHWYIDHLTPAELQPIQEQAERALKLAPNLPEAHVARGVVYYFGHRQYEQALAEFHTAIRLQPNNARAFEFSGYVHRRLGRWEESLADLKKSQEQDPRNSTLLGEIAVSYTRLRLWKEAGVYGEQALAINLHERTAIEELVIAALNGRGDVKEARHLLDTAAVRNSLVPDIGHSVVGGLLGIRAYTCLLEHDGTAALNLFSDDNTAFDERLRRSARVMILLLTGDKAGAHAEAEKGVSLVEGKLRERPDDLDAIVQASWIYLGLERMDEAIAMATYAAELLPPEKDAMVGSITLYNLAAIQCRSSRTNEAIEILRRLLLSPAGGHITTASLRVDPLWDPIRNDPGFQQLLAGKELVGPNK